MQFSLFHENSIYIFFTNIRSNINCVFYCIFILVLAEEGSEEEKADKYKNLPDPVTEDSVTNVPNFVEFHNRLFTTTYRYLELEPIFLSLEQYRTSFGAPFIPNDLIRFHKPGSLDMATIVCIRNVYYLLFSIFFLVTWFLVFSVSTGYQGRVPFSENLYTYKNSVNNDVEAAFFESCSTTEII